MQISSCRYLLQVKHSFGRIYISMVFTLPVADVYNSFQEVPVKFVVCGSIFKFDRPSILDCTFVRSSSDRSWPYFVPARFKISLLAEAIRFASSCSVQVPLATQGRILLPCLLKE